MTSTYEYRVELLWATICVTSVIAVVVAFELIVIWERYATSWRGKRQVRRLAFHTTHVIPFVIRRCSP